MQDTLPHYKKFEEALGHRKGNERTYAKELPSGARAYTVATPARIIDELRRGFPENNHWHECLERRLCDPYIDLDASVKEGFSEEQAIKAKVAITKGMQMALSAFKGENKVVSYGSCGKGKSSWHLVGRHEGFVCESPDIAKMITMVAICLSGEKESVWFAKGEEGGEKSLIDFSVYSHGFLRTVWSTKRGSKRMKVQEGKEKQKPQEGDEVHMVGAPADWAGGVWTAKCVGEMCESWGLTLEGVVAQVSALWAQRTGEMVTRATNRVHNPGVMGLRQGDAGDTTDEFRVACALCETLGPAWVPDGRVVWAQQIASLNCTERVMMVQLGQMHCPYANRTHKSKARHFIHLFLDRAPMQYSLACMADGCKGHANRSLQIVPLEVALTYSPFPVSTALDPVI